ncbi:NUDIX hydrolase [Rhodobacteraceae bacterium LMO-12]|nr:NUDIX hydrolase [Rhodobacteraceae bacterium LMO-JJ12]
MTLHRTKQLPISVLAERKGDMRTQFAALCWRLTKGKPEILLITSRGTNRWIIPKGWPMSGETPGQGALTEAWEEAGVIGKAYEQCLGLYSYTKRVDDDTLLPCVAMIYPVKVAKLAKEFPEAGQRKRKWVSPKKAATLVKEPELAQILKTFDPKYLRK